MMSMHCHVDGSGPCAEPGCSCTGATVMAGDAPDRPDEDRANP